MGNKRKNTKLNNNILTMGMDSTITAKWEVETHKITVKATNGKGGSVIVDYNQDASLKVVANAEYSYDATLGSKIRCDTSINVSYNQDEQQLEFKNVISDTSCEINFIKLEELMPINVVSKYAYTHGDEYSIVVNKDTNERHTFYVISSTEDTVSLIMSENYISKNSTTKYGTERYPSIIFSSMPTVEDWNNIPSPGTYTDNFGYNTVTVDYSAYAARIPTYGELYAACNSGGCQSWIKGSYWTSSPYYSSTSTMNLYYMNNSSISYKSYSNAGGYRPVITLPKSYFNGIIDENKNNNIVTEISTKNEKEISSGDKYNIIVNSSTNENYDFYVLSADSLEVNLIMDSNYIVNGTTEIYGSTRYPKTIINLFPKISDWTSIPTRHI